MEVKLEAPNIAQQSSDVVRHSLQDALQENKHLIMNAHYIFVAYLVILIVG